MSRHARTPPTTWTPSPMPSATPESSTPRIVLGVAGGIAAYKSVEVLRRLRDLGFHVAPVLTPDATRFVGALTFSALASEPARTALFGDPATPIPHTHLGQGADLVLVVPATAHLIARYAMGLADDLLTATLLATRAPVLLCPAMHTEMWEHPSVQENLATLRRRGDGSPGRPRADRRVGPGHRARVPRPPERTARAGERRGHARGHRPGAGDHQSLLGSPGLRPGRGRRAPGRRGHPGQRGRARPGPRRGATHPRGGRREREPDA